MNRILIVDDKEENLYLLRALLTGHGYEVDEARHGAEALTKARLAPPRLIISDLLMPVMDGYTLLRHWKADERLEQIPFVVYTATYTEPKDEKLALDLGADAFILKPAEPELFMARIREVLAKEQAGGFSEPQQSVGEEQVLLKEYSETLIRKLETKMFQLEQDITERKRAEAALRVSEAGYRTLIESASDGIFIADAQGRYVDVNALGCRMLGYARKELLALSIPDVVAAEEMARVAPEVAALKVGEVVRSEWQFRRKDGTLFPGEVSGTILPDGRLLGILRDVTERKQAEAALRESEERLRLAVDGGGVGLWEWQIATGHLTWNGQLKTIFGLPPETMGLTLEKFMAAIHAEDLAETERTFRAALKNHTEFNREYRILWPDGTVRWIVATGRGEYDADGQPVRMLGAALDITERKRTEAVVRETQRQLTSLIANVPGVVYRCRNDRNWTTEFVSEGVLQLFGYPAADFLEHRREIGQSVHPDDRGRVWEEVQTALRERRRYELTYRITTASGEEKWLWEQGAGVFDASGTLQALEGFAIDITERKQAETAVRESEARFRLLAENIQDVFWITTPTIDRMIYVSPAYERIWGRTCESNYQQPRSFTEAIHPGDQGRVIAALEGHAQGEWDIEYRIIRPDGTVRWILDRGFPIRDERGELVQMCGIASDITRRKQAEAALRESEERLRHVLDGLGPQMFAGLLDPQGTVLLANRPALEAAMLRSEEVLGKPVESTYWWTWSEAVSQRLRAAVERAAQGEAVRYDEQIRVAEGQLIWLDFSIQPLRDETGRIRFLVPSGLVITERKRAEGAVQQSREQLRALTQRLQSAREEEARRIARELHDELGQMLTGLKMDLRWVERDLEDGEASARSNALLEKVVAASELVDATVRTVQRIASELRSGLLDKLGLPMALRHESQQFQQRTGVVCRLRVPDPEPRLPAEVATACYRICQEALTNVARHAVATEVEIEFLEEGRGAEEQKGGAWVLEVRDNGKGIAAAKLADPHSLGLLGMQERVRQLGGEVVISGGPGRGTTVRLRVPVTSDG